MEFVNKDNYNNLWKDINKKELTWSKEKAILLQKIEIWELKLNESNTKQEELKNSYNLLINTINCNNPSEKEVKNLSDNTIFKNLNNSISQINDYVDKNDILQILNYDYSEIKINELIDENNNLKNQINLINNNDNNLNNDTFSSIIDKNKLKKKFNKKIILENLKKYFLVIINNIEKSKIETLYFDYDNKKLFMSENMKKYLNESEAKENFEKLFDSCRFIFYVENDDLLKNNDLANSLFYPKENKLNRSIEFDHNEIVNKRNTHKNNRLNIDNNIKGINKRKTHKNKYNNSKSSIEELNLNNSNLEFEFENNKSFEKDNNLKIEENFTNYRKTHKISPNNNIDQTNLNKRKTHKNDNKKLIIDKYNNIKKNIENDPNIKLNENDYFILNSFRESKSIDQQLKDALFNSKFNNSIIKESVNLQNLNNYNFEDKIKLKRENLYKNFNINYN